MDVPNIKEEAHAVCVEHTDDVALLDPKRNSRVLRAMDMRILPILMFIFLINYLDRSNIGNAKVLNKETKNDLLSSTHMTAHQFAITLTIFSIVYGLFEVPSNWIMKNYVRPSRWLATLLFAWGAFTLGFAGVKNYASVVIIRMFVGIFEAGFLPGLVFLVTMWYRVEERSFRLALIISSAALAGAFGGCIAYGMGHLNMTAGLEGFRWLFIVEGTITIASVGVILFLPDYPSTARWLSPEDKEFCEKRLQPQAAGFERRHATRKEILATCLSPRMLLHYFAYINNCIPLASLTFLTPTIVVGLGYTSVTAQLMTIPPWAVAYLVSLVISWTADRFNMRGYNIAISSTIAGIGWLMAATLPTHAYAQRYGALILAACGALPCSCPLTSWVTCNVPSLATMGIAIALNNMATGISQIITQWIWLPGEAARGFPTGNAVCASASFVTAICALILRYWYGRMNNSQTKDASGTPRIWQY